MRQIVSLVKDNQVHYALVDTDSGEMIPFADLLIPDPDRFGLHESALLGTNLIDVLGLNGAKRPRAADVHVGSLTPTHKAASEPEVPALASAAPESAAERKKRLDRERWHARKDSQRKAGPSKGGVQRYISMDEVVAVVNQYPEGIRTRDVATRIWRLTDGRDTDTEHPGWLYQSVSNRIVKAKDDFKRHGTPMPVRIEDRPTLNKDGSTSNMLGQFLLPADPTPIAT